jgi:hypothetical protein
MNQQFSLLVLSTLIILINFAWNYIMDQSNPIEQKIRKTYESSLEVAMKYYGLISILNGLKLTKREIELLGFMATRGGILNGGTRADFVTRFKSSKATVNNLVSDLQEIGLLIKNGGKISVNPQLLLSFSQPLTIEISLHAADRQTS